MYGETSTDAWTPTLVTGQPMGNYCLTQERERNPNRWNEMNRNTGFATHTLIQLPENKQHYNHFRKTIDLSMTFGRVRSSNTQQKKANFSKS